MIVDSHAHFMKDSPIKMFDASIETWIEYMDNIGCDYMIQSPIGALDRITCLDDFASTCIDIYEKSDGRILSYFVFNPKYSDTCIDIIKNYHSHPAFVGIKIHPAFHLTWADDPSYKPSWEAAGRYTLPLMSHTWALTSNPNQKYSVPEKFEKYIKEYPNVSFIFGHSGGRTDGIREAAAIGEKYPNTYFDIAGDVYNRRLIEYLTKKVGADRVLLASDTGWFDLAFQMGMVIGSNLSLAEKELVLGENAAKLFKIEA